MVFGLQSSGRHGDLWIHLNTANALCSLLKPIYLTFADDNQEAVKNWWDDNHLFDERKDALDRGILKAIELIKQQCDRC